MTDTIRHRGPDDSGSWIDEDIGIALGFRRLAIVDLSPTGHQPMLSHSGRFVITFNGEIYNYRQIADDLAGARLKFRGSSDTEVALTAIENWGLMRALQSFNGMFAFAVWDRRERTLSLARDRTGKKPLFIQQHGRNLIFGSELKALAAHPEFRREVSSRALASYLRYMYIPAPNCIYENTVKLPPGTFVTIHAPHTPIPAPVTYWEVPQPAVIASAPSPHQRTQAEHTLSFQELLLDATALRMHADVPLGALLSGGIDSTAVVAAMTRLSTKPVRTFSIGFDSTEHDESEQASRLARYLGTDHTALRVDGRAALEVVPLIPSLYDEPLADPSGIPTFLVCRLARQHVTVALTGDGGDELFAGYHRYISGERIISRAARLPLPARMAIAKLLDAAPNAALDLAGRAAGIRLLPEKAIKLASMLRQRSQFDMYDSLLSVNQEPADLLQHRKVAEEPPVAWDSSAGILRAMLYADQRIYLPDDLLAKLDRASMRVSLEARAPLLDYRLLEFSWSLPHDELIVNRLGKQPLRQTLAEWVPRYLWERPKMGFSVPLEEWLRGPLSSFAGDLLSSTTVQKVGLLHPVNTQRLWESFRRGRRGIAAAVWTAAVLQAWGLEWLAPDRQSAQGARTAEILG